MGPRNETKEGLDLGMALHYYSRARFIDQLLPLLTAGDRAAHVISVYAAGMETKLFEDDPDLRKPGHYSFDGARSHVVHMKTMYFEGLAQTHPGKLSLTHVFPGLVITPAFDSPERPWWFRLTWKVSSPFARFMATPAEECGPRLLYFATDHYPAASSQGFKQSDDVALGTDGLPGSGAYACDGKGEPVSGRRMQEKYGSARRAELRDMLNNHTKRVFDDIEGQGSFKG